MSKFWKAMAISILSIIFIASGILGGIGLYDVVYGSSIFEMQEPNQEVSSETSSEDEKIILIDEAETFSYFLDKEKYFALTPEQLTKVLNDACKIISYTYLSLETCDTVEIYYDKTCTYRGYHDGNTIRLNLYNIARAKQEHEQMLTTLAHEVRHDFQEEQVNKGYENALTQSYKNYVSSKTDFDKYYSQLAEKDARMFADYMVNYITTAYKTK